jgi:hypothetical protein
MHALGPDDFTRLQESMETTLVGVVPIAAKIETDCSEISVESLTVYSDRMSLHTTVRMREGHPELEWRDRGRPGHPYTAIGVRDDIGTNYLVMPGSGGGGQYEYRQEVRIVPNVPSSVKQLTVLVAATDWEGRMGFLRDGSRADPDYIWSIAIEMADITLARNALVINQQNDHA